MSRGGDRFVDIAARRQLAAKAMQSQKLEVSLRSDSGPILECVVKRALRDVQFSRQMFAVEFQTARQRGALGRFDKREFSFLAARSGGVRERRIGTSQGLDKVADDTLAPSQCGPLALASVASPCGCALAARHWASSRRIAAGYDLLLAKYEVRRVNHSKEYRADDGTTNNLAESYFSRFRRFQIGQVHKLSPKYLDNYANEIAYREDTRRWSNGHIFLDQTT